MCKRRIIEHEITALRQQLAEKENELKSIKWRPNKKHDRLMFTILNDATVFKTSSSSKVVDFGCAFKTQKRAEHAAHVYRRFHLLYKLAEELNDSEEGFNENWTIQYFSDSKKLIPVRLEMTVGGMLPMVYFKTKALAEKAIEIIQNGGLE